jgi:hypothetical protein
MAYVPTLREIAAIQEQNKARGDAARMMSDDGDTPEPGHFYTVSKSFSSGDGSWTDVFWEVLSVNGPKAYVKIHTGYTDPVVRFWEIGDRAWYLADDAWAICHAPQQESGK